MRKPLFAANWKMNNRLEQIQGFVSELLSNLEKGGKSESTDFEIVVAPMAVHIPEFVSQTKSNLIQVAAQNCGTTDFGAFTGELSPVALCEVGAQWVILGHSERRHVFGETESMLAERLSAAEAHGLRTIYCIGEGLEDRKAGKTFDVLQTQLETLKAFNLNETSLTLAYEPVWAIGTGETATPEQAEQAHLFIRDWVASNMSPALAGSVRILYGGSVKPANALELLGKNNVDGFLVGGASLEASTFAQVILNGLQCDA